MSLLSVYMPSSCWKEDPLKKTDFEGLTFQSQLILFYDTGITRFMMFISAELTENVSISTFLYFCFLFITAFGCASATSVFGQQPSGGSVFGQVSSPDCFVYMKLFSS